LRNGTIVALWMVLAFGREAKKSAVDVPLSEKIEGDGPRSA